jgi:hypothetical protein
MRLTLAQRETLSALVASRMSSEDTILAAQLGQQLLSTVADLEQRLQTANAALAVERENGVAAERVAERRLSQMNDCEQRYKHAAAECEQLHAALTASERQTRSVEQALRAANEQLGAALADSNRLNNELLAFQTELAALKRAARTSQRQRSATDAAPVEPRSDADDQLAAANGRVEHLESMLRDAAAEILSLRSALDGFAATAAQVSQLRDANAELTRRLEESRAEAAALADHVSDVTKNSLAQSLSQAELADASSGSVLDELRELMQSPGVAMSPPPLVATSVGSTAVPAAAAGAKTGELRMRVQRSGANELPWAKRRVSVQAGALVYHGQAVEHSLVVGGGSNAADEEQLPRQGVLALRGASVKLVPLGDAVVLSLGVRAMLLNAANEAVGATFRFYELRGLADKGDDSELLSWASALESEINNVAPRPQLNQQPPAPATTAAATAKPTQVCVVLIENECRLTPLHSWSASETGGLASFITGTDVPHWTTNLGVQCAAKDSFVCPKGRQWSSDRWTLTEPPQTGSFISETLARTDMHGWQYAPKWATPGPKWLAEPTAGCLVRRRWWKRLCTESEQNR